MRLTAMGKLTMLILVAGVSFGGWRLWQRQQIPNSGGQNNSGNQNKGGQKGGGWKMPSIPFVSGKGGEGGGNAGNSNDILLITSASKKGWLQDQINRFNQSNSGQYKVTTKFIETREAMHAILESKERPVLWSPSSTIWAARVAEAWTARNGSSILNLADQTSFRVYLRSPIVFLTTTDKARFLRPLLSSSEGWQRVRELSLGRRRVPWGRFKFSHADPINANSGMLTLGAILLDYGQRSGQMGSLEQAAAGAAFGTYLRELGRSLVFDEPAKKGSSTLMQAFLDDPSRYDFITAYENSALDAMAKNPNLAVIYPNPTVVSEHAVCRLSGGWVSQQQSEGAQAFMEFLGSPEALQDGVKNNLRPLQSGGVATLPVGLSNYTSHGFQQSFNSAELPPYRALNVAAFKWRNNIAKR